MQTPRSKRIALLTAIALGILTHVAPATAAPGDAKAVLGKFGTTEGSGAGQTRQPRGVAVSRTGAGGAEAGDVYLADTGNNRVDVFSATGAFKRAFGLGVDETSGGDVCTAASEDICKAGISSGAAGSVAAPTGVAIDQTTGTVYVTSEANDRVDVFSAAGDFEGAFGWEVDADTPAEELQFCTVACQAATASAAAGGLALKPKLNTNSLPAVGPGGDIYVPDPGNVRVDEYRPTFNGSEVTGISFVRAVGWEVAVVGPLDGIQECTVLTGCQQGTIGSMAGQFSEGNPSSVDVTATGDIYATNLNRAVGTSCTATNPCKVVKINASATEADDFAASALTSTSGAQNATASLAVAVDPASQDLFVAKKVTTTEYRLLELSPTGTLLATSPVASGLTSAPATTRYGLAVGTEERVYVSTQPSSGTAGQVYLLGPVPPPTAAFGEVSDVSSREATFSGTVTPPAEVEGSTFDTHWRFEYSADQSDWTRAPIPDGDAGPVPGTGVPVEVTVKGLEPSRRYFVRLCAATGPTVCAPEPVAQFTTLGSSPEILETYGADITQTSATLGARVNPENSATTYYFEWGPTPVYGHRTPAFDRPIGSGGTSITAAEELGGLQANTVYHYRIVATNATGPTIGPDHHFTTLNSAGFPNDRGLELVSPMPLGIQGFVGRILATQLPWQVAGSGQSVLFPVVNGSEDTTKGGEVRYQANRANSGWQSRQLSPPSLVVRGQDEGTNAQTSYVHWASEGLSCSLLESVNPFTDAVPAIDREVGVTNLYSRDAVGNYTLISNTIPANPTQQQIDPYFTVAGASEDCSRVYFSSTYELLAGGSGLYEWNQGTLRDAGILPDGTSATGGPASVGIGGEVSQTPRATRANAVSGAGASRFFFTATSNEAPDQGKRAVFVRDGTDVVDVSKPTTAGTALGAHYETASPDGSRVFFTANYGLADNGSSTGPAEDCSTGLEEHACDLYEYDIESGDLTDLSVDPNPADPKGAGVEGVVAVSNEGDVVYFAALGQLIPGEGNTYAQNLEAPGAANLYVVRGPSRTLSYVATVSHSDLGASGRGGLSEDSGAHAMLMKYAGSWNAQVTPDGGQLLFVSDQPQTGYNSGGASEAYLYSLADRRVICVSCRRDGKPSVESPGLTPIYGTPGQRSSQLDYPRAMSADGSRVFFTIADALAPGAVSGAKNLYMWEDGSVYLLNTETKGVPPQPSEVSYGNVFYGASESGDDVFFVSLNRLVPQDKDSVQSLYDLRIGGGFAPEPEPPASCDPLVEGACQGGPASPAPSSSTPVTPGFQGPGNQPSSSGKHKKKHHKKHKRHHRKKQHRKKHKGKGMRAKHKQAVGNRATHHSSRHGGDK